MKLNLLLLLLLSNLLFFSCKKEETYKPRIIKNITLQKFDHTKFGLKKMSSIRAIEIIDSTAYFIGSNSKVYGFYKNGNFLITPNDFFGDSIVNFRASGHAKDKLYALSIESPALLYQITLDKKEGLKNPKIVYKENHKKAFYDAMAFFDSQNGIAIGDPTEDCLSIGDFYNLKF